MQMSAMAEEPQPLLIFQRILNVAECPSCCSRTVGPSCKVCLGNRHAVCSGCSGASCHSCRQDYHRETPAVLRNILKELPTNCEYAKAGCAAVAVPRDHVPYCRLRPFRCLIPHCEWTGTVHTLRPHVEDHHKAFYIEGFRIEHIHEFCYAFFKNGWTSQTFYFKVGDDLFLLLAHVTAEGSFRQVVRHVPIGKPTQRTFFELSFGTEGRSWFGSTLPAYTFDPVEDLFSTIHCMVVPVIDLKPFSTGVGHLRMNVYTYRRLIQLSQYNLTRLDLHSSCDLLTSRFGLH